MTYPTIVAATPNTATYLTGALADVWEFNQSFFVASTSGWVEVDADGNPTQNRLGASGPFVVLVDAEGVLCSDFDELTGQVFVWQNDGSDGRAYSGDIAAHSKGQAGDTNVTIVGTSAQENLGGGGGGGNATELQGVPIDDTTPTDGQILQYDEETSSWSIVDNNGGSGITSLVDDVTATVEDGVATTTVAALQGTTLTLTDPADGDVIEYSEADSAFINTPGGGGGSSPTVTAASLTESVTINNASTETIMTSDSLDVGDYLVTFGALIESSNANCFVVIEVIEGTATATFAGQAGAVTQFSQSGEDETVSLSCVVTVTEPGTIIFQGQTLSNFSATVLASPSGQGLPSVFTGYTIMPVTAG